MFHRLLLWLLFAACLAVVLAAMGWVSLAAFRADRAETVARQQSATEEKIRLALWRIDTALAPLLAEENARPYFVYRPFFPAGAETGRTPGATIPSPLLKEPPPHVVLHFQFGPDGRLTSPESPTGADRVMAVPKYLGAKQAEEAAKRLADAAGSLDRARLAALLPKQELKRLEAASLLARQTQNRVALGSNRADAKQSRAGREFALRNEALTQNANAFMQTQQQINALESPDAATPQYDASGVLMTPLWIDGRLVLARRFSMDRSEYVQGCLLDWPVVKSSLLDGIADLLPKADLLPAPKNTSGDESRRPAALPLLLAPGEVVDNGEPATRPIVVSLAVAWACVSLAAVAVALLLWGVVRLSERRAAFVSAVTHELRTPLTTFQMYAEMLAENMVPEAAERQRYLNTLRAEAIRLTHLVENVLAYARLERGRTAGRIEPVGPAELIEDAAGRLAARAEQAGMTLVVEGVEPCARATILANRSAVEQVLFNLVDNACKYAGAATDRRIHLGVELRDRQAEIYVADHGPGIAPSVRRRLFQSFSKTAEEAAASAPGIGLGLALCRRLARDMGGDLRLDENTAGGARFVLSLPYSSRIIL